MTDAGFTQTKRDLQFLFRIFFGILGKSASTNTFRSSLAEVEIRGGDRGDLMCAQQGRTRWGSRPQESSRQRCQSPGGTTQGGLGRQR